jgi:hypothetical protein
MATVRNFVVISNKFNVETIFINLQEEVPPRPKKNQYILIIIIFLNIFTIASNNKKLTHVVFYSTTICAQAQNIHLKWCIAIHC